MTDSLTPVKKPFWPTVSRATRGRCPSCGEGKLFRSYLKPVASCSSCNEALGHIRADDGPAWLTIVIVSHILAPVVLAIMPGNNWPVIGILAALLIPATALMLAMLPLAKGLFIGCIWRAGCTGSEE